MEEEEAAAAEVVDLEEAVVVEVEGLEGVVVVEADLAEAAVVVDFEVESRCTSPGLACPMTTGLIVTEVADSR